MLTGSDSRRDFIKKSVYVVPMIFSLNVALVEASSASMPPNQGRGGDPPHGNRGNRGKRPTRDLER